MNKWILHFFTYSLPGEVSAKDEKIKTVPQMSNWLYEDMFSCSSADRSGIKIFEERQQLGDAETILKVCRYRRVLEVQAVKVLQLGQGCECIEGAHFAARQPQICQCGAG